MKIRFVEYEDSWEGLKNKAYEEAEEELRTYEYYADYLEGQEAKRYNKIKKIVEDNPDIFEEDDELFQEYVGLQDTAIQKLAQEKFKDWKNETELEYEKRDKWKEKVLDAYDFVLEKLESYKNIVMDNEKYSLTLDTLKQLGDWGSYYAIIRMISNNNVDVFTAGKLRISDHYAPEGGGWFDKPGYGSGRYEEPDINIVFGLDEDFDKLDIQNQISEFIEELKKEF